MEGDIVSKNFCFLIKMKTSEKITVLKQCFFFISKFEPLLSYLSFFFLLLSSYLKYLSFSIFGIYTSII